MMNFSLGAEKQGVKIHVALKKKKKTSLQPQESLRPPQKASISPFSSRPDSKRSPFASALSRAEPRPGKVL